MTAGRNIEKKERNIRKKKENRASFYEKNGHSVREVKNGR